MIINNWDKIFYTVGNNTIQNVGYVYASITRILWTKFTVV